jgi:hypothetical protein
MDWMNAIEYSTRLAAITKKNPMTLLTVTSWMGYDPSKDSQTKNHFAVFGFLGN